MARARREGSLARVWRIMPNGREERDISGVLINHFMYMANSVTDQILFVLSNIANVFPAVAQDPDIQHRY
jgi:hypothetical protein